MKESLTQAMTFLFCLFCIHVYTMYMYMCVCVGFCVCLPVYFSIIFNSKLSFSK